jgi:hypothetical protein
MHKKLLVLIAILGAVTLAAVWASPRGSEATVWTPTFGPPGFYTLSDTAVGANPNSSAQFGIAKPSSNFSALFGRAITFGDPDIAVSSDAAIANGSYMGSLFSVAILGTANDGCFVETPVTFNFVDANTVSTALAMTPGVTLTGAIGAGDVTFTYTSTGDPIGPSDSNPAHTRAEIQIDAEQMLVTSITEGTNTYAGVVRGWNGTTAAAHAASAPILKVNTIFPAGPTSNLLANMAEDDGDLDNNGTAEFPAMLNDVADGADALPGFIRDSFDPDGDPDNGGYVAPHARYYGVDFVAGALIVTLQFVINAPGTLTQYQSLDFAQAAYGFSSTTFLQDPLAPPSNSAITDFCLFSSSTSLFGIPHDNDCTDVGAPPAGCTAPGAGFILMKAVDNGCPAGAPSVPNECGNQNGGPPEVVRTTNPAVAQRVRFLQYSVSQRDYDNDGIENALDTCHSDANPGWNPYEPNILSGGDADGDGAPDACDTVAGAVPDQDADAWTNRIDNCPTIDNDDPGPPPGGGGTVANTFQFDQDLDPGAGNIATDVPDGGPASDSIGPACDIAGESCGGCPALTSTGPNGHYHASFTTQTICIGAVTDACDNGLDGDGNGDVDLDNDGVVNARDTCLEAANPPDTYPAGVGNATLTAAEAVGSTVLNVGPAPATDGFEPGQAIVVGSPLETLRYIVSVDEIAGEITIGAIPGAPGLSSPHAIGAPVAAVRFAQSSFDTNNNGTVGVIDDLAAVAGAAFTSGGNPALPGGYQARYDTNNNNSIGVIDDLAAFAGAAFKTC